MAPIFLLFITSLLCSFLQPAYSYSSLIPSAPPKSFTRKLPEANPLPRHNRNTPTAFDTTSRRRRRWHRRVLRRVLRRPDDDDNRPSTQLQAVALHREPDVGYVLRNFATNSPETLFPPGATTALPLPPPVGSPLSRLASRKCERLLEHRLDQWSQGQHDGLCVQCDPSGSAWQLLRGQFRTDATIMLDRIVFPNIQFSGGKLEIVDFALNLLSFAPERITLGPLQRFPRAFRLIGKDFVLTEDDIFQSGCIRNGLRRLFTRILNNNGLPTMGCDIHSIQLLPDGRLACVGEAMPMFGPPISFEIRTGLGFKGRGHILTFPGLELSVHRSLGLFVPIPSVTVDLGHNARIHHLAMDGTALRMSMRVNITPDHTLHLKGYTQSTNAYGAQCSVDVGRWLTRLGRFSR